MILVLSFKKVFKQGLKDRICTGQYPLNQPKELFSLFLLEMEKQQLIELTVLPQLLGIAESFSDDFLVCQVHAKNRAIEVFIAVFSTVLLYELPVALQCPMIIVKFSIKLVHDLVMACERCWTLWKRSSTILAFGNSCLVSLQ